MKILWQGKKQDKKTVTEIIVFSMFDEVIAFVAHQDLRTGTVVHDHQSALTILRDVDFKKEIEEADKEIHKNKKQKWY